MELFHAASHSDWSRWLVVAVPSAEPRDDPACGGEAARGMRIALALGLAFQGRAESRERLDFRLAEHGRCRQLRAAVAFLGELDIDAGGFGRRGCEFDQAFCVGDLAVFQ